jgi:hypothetical protein
MGIGGATTPRPVVIQQSLYAALQKAETFAEQGEFRQAVAYADFVLNPRVLRVRLDLSGVVTSQRADAEAAVVKAAKAWEDSLGNEVEIRFVTGGVSAVRIGFRSDLKVWGADAAGHLVWSRNVVQIGDDYSAQVSADMTLRTLSPGGRCLTLDNMTHAALHEFGHVFGLNDSHWVGDIMGPQDLNRPITKISERELTPLREVRREAQSIVHLAEWVESSATLFAPR